MIRWIKAFLGWDRFPQFVSIASVIPACIVWYHGKAIRFTCAAIGFNFGMAACWEFVLMTRRRHERTMAAIMHLQELPIEKMFQTAAALVEARMKDRAIDPDRN